MSDKRVGPELLEDLLRVEITLHPTANGLRTEPRITTLGKLRGKAVDLALGVVMKAGRVGGC